MGCAGVDGGAGVFALSREQLQRWYFVEEMSPTQLQQKYRVECGVYADRAALVKWLRVLLQNPECIVFFHIWFKLLSGVVGFCHLVIFHRTPPAFVFGGRYLLAFFFVGLLYWYKILFFERRPGSGFPSSAAARRYMPILAARMSSISSGAACHPKMSGGWCSGSIWSRRLATGSWRISASVPDMSDDWVPCRSLYPCCALSCLSPYGVAAAGGCNGGFG